DQRLAAPRRRLDDLALIAVPAEDRERLLLVRPRKRGADQVSRAPGATSGGTGLPLDHHQDGREQERRGFVAEALGLQHEASEPFPAGGQVPQAAEAVLLEPGVDPRPGQCLKRGVVLVYLEVRPLRAAIAVSLSLHVPGVDQLLQVLADPV